MNRKDFSPEPVSPSPQRLTVQGYPLDKPVPRRLLGIQHLAAWKNSPEHTDAWLCKIIGGAFQTFVARALQGQPAAEMLPLTAQIWVDDLLDMGLNEKQDKERLETALRGLNRKLKEWPQVANLIELLPRRDTSSPANEVKVSPGHSDAAHAAAMEALAKLKESGIS